MTDSVSKRISAATRVSLLRIAMQGCVPSGPIAKGYTYKKIPLDARGGGSRWGRKPIPDPDVAPLVKLAFEMQAGGATARMILERTGLLKSSSGLSTMLRNRAYIGEFEYQGEVFRNIYPPLVSTELFEAAGARIVRFETGTSARFHPRRKGFPSYFLANVAVCGYCGGHVGGKRVGKYRYYTCARYGKRSAASPQARGFVAGRLEAGVLAALLAHTPTRAHLPPYGAGGDWARTVAAFLANEQPDWPPETYFELRAIADALIARIVLYADRAEVSFAAGSGGIDAVV